MDSVSPGKVTLANSMHNAWAARWQRAATELSAILRAPALFKPERVEQVVTEHRRARAEMGRWSV